MVKDHERSNEIHHSMLTRGEEIVASLLFHADNAHFTSMALGDGGTATGPWEMALWNPAHEEMEDLLEIGSDRYG